MLTKGKRGELEEGRPLVSICCETYNHAKYVRDAIEGFLIQKTDFAFEILIHDDASTDGTQDIIKEYCAKFPDLFRPIFQNENQHGRGIKIWGEIQFPRVRGKYIALCEGDDYWTDPLKLQRQVDFLESHPDYTLCFHNAMVHHENGDTADHKFAQLETREYNVRENIDNWIVPTASILYRKTVLETDVYRNYLNNRNKFVVGDQPLILSCAAAGKLYGFSDVMSVYRLQQGGWTQQTRLASKLAYKLIVQEIAYMRIFGGYRKKIGHVNIAKHSRAAFSLLIQKKLKEALKVWGIALKNAPIQTLKYNIIFTFKALKSKN